MINSRDTKHEIIKTIEGGAELHRFKNGAGVEYSAIYIRDDEVWSCPRAKESRMLKDWSRDYKIYIE